MPETSAPVTVLERRPLPAAVSLMAEKESWRKERHRPATYVHKWWARRLGTVFRRLLLEAADQVDGRSAAQALAGHVVFDPFAGSGTTVVEAAKLEARVIARDINPVATLTQRQAVQKWNLPQLEALYAQVAAACQSKIDALFLTRDGQPVLHYFWVAVAVCPDCAEDVELFSSYLFAKHAYPDRHPLAHATCPRCHDVVPVTVGTDARGHCRRCVTWFDFAGPVKNRMMTCSNGHRHNIVSALAAAPPRRRMYAKAVKTPEGRTYASIEPFDVELYRRASQQLARSAPGSLVRPSGTLTAGENTVQALRWGYANWAQFFNDRQLYCLGLLAAALRDLPGQSREREALIAVLGKTLEHHNLFCSFKGEGTGPVRSIFHNHVLRPERCSVEGNPWGAAGGSGGYAQALERLKTAHAYKQSPTDHAGGDKRIDTIEGRSKVLDLKVVHRWEAFLADPRAAYLSAGDAACTDLPNQCVSMVITDPPYVDNVHYSELADFFHAWLRNMRPHAGYPVKLSTRSPAEVQNASADLFEQSITGVWKECHRVLADPGILVFSFHQSRTAGWMAVMKSLKAADFEVTATWPVVGEVANSLSKVGAVAPNRIDVIVVCRKRRSGKAQNQPLASPGQVQDSLRDLSAAGIAIGPGDMRSAIRAAVLAQGTRRLAAAWDDLSASADEQAEKAVQQLAGDAIQLLAVEGKDGVNASVPG